MDDAFYRVPLSFGEAQATLTVLRAVAAWIAAGAEGGDIEPGILESAAGRIAGEVPDFVADQAAARAAALLRIWQSEGNGGNGDAPWPGDAPPFPIRRTRRLLEDAFERRVPVEIEYFVQSRNEWTTRRVDIGDVYQRDDTWYVSGQDSLRDDFRLFRLDHIRTIRLLDDENAAGAAGDGFDPFAVE